MKHFQLFEQFITEAKRKLLGSGQEQSAYVYEEDPNWVLKVYDRSAYKTRTAEQAIDRLQELSDKYPKLFATVKRTGDREYLQQRLDIKSLDKDINAVCIKIWNQVAKDYEQALASKIDSPVTDYIKTYIEYKIIEKPATVKTVAELDDIMNELKYYGRYVQFLGDAYVWKYYSNSEPLAKKLKPILDNDELNGDLHSSNLGYDSSGNVKVLDI